SARKESHATIGCFLCESGAIFFSCSVSSLKSKQCSTPSHISCNCGLDLAHADKPFLPSLLATALRRSYFKEPRPCRHRGCIAHFHQHFGVEPPRFLRRLRLR